MNFFLFQICGPVYCALKPQLIYGVHRYKFLDTEQGGELDKVLMPGRRAKVRKVRCVTSCPNSLLQGRTPEKKHPVQMGTDTDTLWIPELEKLFGFPEHYTDVANLPPTRRQKVLGKSWSIPVVRRLLLPLRVVYALTRTEQEVQEQGMETSSLEEQALGEYKNGM